MGKKEQGGTEERWLPYGRQQIDADDIRAVTEALTSDWLTTGPRVAELEGAIASRVGAKHAVAVSSGTAALHCALAALGIGPGDEVLVPALTFVATANAAVFLGARPVFVDIDPATLLVDVSDVARKLTPQVKAIVVVDYAGQPCDYAALRALAARHGIPLVADACHALGASEGGRPVGSLADVTAFSFHPVKHITTCEGGLVTMDRAEVAKRARAFRNHGIDTDAREREARGTWRYEMTSLGFNYRLSDVQCALGLSQLRHLDDWIRRRNELARRYDAALASSRIVRPLATRPGVTHAYHLYVVQTVARAGVTRDELLQKLRAERIAANVHYLPVPHHAFYRERFGTRPEMCPAAASAFERILSLPLFPAMSDGDVDRVVRAIEKAAQAPALKRSA